MEILAPPGRTPEYVPLSVDHLGITHDPEVILNMDEVPMSRGTNSDVSVPFDFKRSGSVLGFVDPLDNTDGSKVD